MEELELTPQVGNAIFLTPEGHKNLSEELEYLTVKKRAEIAERIRDSKQHGEFSEDNNELGEIKFEQALTESRIAELKQIFSNAQIITSDSIPTSQVGIGSFVTVKDVDRSIEFEIRMVASIEADPDQDLVSHESPLGIALFGKKVGDTVTFDAPAGKIKYLIVGIRK